MALGFLCLTSIQIQAQDLIAVQAPIDRKLKMVDSVALQRLIETDELENGVSLYTTWNNSKTHCYSSVALPDSFKIDLRGFAMPTKSRNITSGYGYRASFKRYHKGLDIKVYIGDTIVSAFNGKVRIVKYDANGYGKYVVIRHNNGLETIYGHLSKQLVNVNDEVKAGEPIGLGGNTGFSFGSHLHFETRLLGEAIDPKLLFDFPSQDVTGDFFVYHKKDTQRNITLADNSERTSKSQYGDNHFYQVKKGDTLANIAKKIGISIDVLCATNNLKRNSKIRPKQILKY